MTQTPPIPAADCQAHTSAIKRCIEKLRGDGELRTRCEASRAELESLLHGEGVMLTPELLDPLWKLEVSEEQRQVLRTAPELAGWRDWIAGRNAYLDDMVARPDRAEAPYRDWRRRQMKRCDIELGDSLNKVLPHAAAAIELSSGCSVGCWFCGISADKFRGHFAFNDENKALWRGVLEALQEVVGEGLGSTALYWATDPTDNPDYAEFAADFYEHSGHLPQTTTARPVKDVEWTRRVLNLRRELGQGGVDRFSILSTADLRRVHEAFSPEELRQVDLVLHNKGALGEDQTKASAGKARQANECPSRKPKPLNEDQETIACVSGFLVNMVEQRVRLISPCRTSSEWPEGYRVYADERFESPEHLRQILSRWTKTVFTEDALDRPAIGFHRDAEYLPSDNGFVIRTRHKERRVEGAPELRFLGDRIAERRWSRQRILEQGTAAGLPLLSLVGVLGQLAALGLLDDDPSEVETAAIAMA